MAELFELQRVEEARFGSDVEAAIEAFHQLLVLLGVFHQQADKGLVRLAESRKLVGNGVPVGKGSGSGVHVSVSRRISSPSG
ncbi:hypothetical protein D3C87_1806170 [compost metagenome]